MSQICLEVIAVIQIDVLQAGNNLSSAVERETLFKFRKHL